ncbi:hypothetical protein QR680_010203 [Steinernema hermaphroditum]|uniref:Uncharacterized protein n=1 Tax=Steinernema hermaphroditum TaxID=289476 RepID=A0AA39MBC5_9BILA|nr:hypothetical protein QR680_010203 [Steinernema hermaphroditum]
MDDIQLAVGIFYLVFPWIGFPVYARIIYIFLSRKDYRQMECYRIMTLMGIIQCMTTAPTYSLGGLVHVLGYDPFWIASTVAKTFPGGFRAEAALSLVLALNRLRIICELHYPRTIHYVLVLLSVVVSFSYSTALFFPRCGFGFIPGVYLGIYQIESEQCEWIVFIGSLLILIPSIITFLIYVVIILYLIRLKLKTSIRHGLSDELRILFYALLRFSVDFSLEMVFHYAGLPHIPIYDIPQTVAVVFSGIYLSPMMYLILSKQLRQKFLRNSNETEVIKISAPTNVRIPNRNYTVEQQPRFA